MGKFQRARGPWVRTHGKRRVTGRPVDGMGRLSPLRGGMSTHTAAQAPGWPSNRAGGPWGLRLCRRRSRPSGPASGPVSPPTNSVTGPASTAGGVVYKAGLLLHQGLSGRLRDSFHGSGGWRVESDFAFCLCSGDEAVGSSQAILLQLPRRAWPHSAGDSSVHIVTFW